MNRHAALLVGSMVLWAGTGCAHVGTAEKVATTGLVHLTQYEEQIARKIRAESDYYDQVLNNATLRVNELWSNEQPFKLEQDSKRFAAAAARSKAEDIGPRLRTFVEETLKSWAARDDQYVALVSEVTTTLLNNEKSLEMEKTRIAELRNKLQTLAQAASDKELLQLAISFARETKDKFSELSEKAAAQPSK